MCAAPQARRASHRPRQAAVRGRARGHLLTGSRQGRKRPPPMRRAHPGVCPRKPGLAGHRHRALPYPRAERKPGISSGILHWKELIAERASRMTRLPIAPQANRAAVAGARRTPGRNRPASAPFGFLSPAYFSLINWSAFAFVRISSTSESESLSLRRSNSISSLQSKSG